MRTRTKVGLGVAGTAAAAAAVALASPAQASGGHSVYNSCSGAGYNVLMEGTWGHDSVPCGHTWQDVIGVQDRVGGTLWINGTTCFHAGEVAIVRYNLTVSTSRSTLCY